ncbi:ParB/RepB/Spo0J family partition protein [Bifidobacterium apri]|uniref:ParB/RepB/Spo0J family partition protein n=1 Tax=Bifidobacterium apri TaxID=1769423 RepID=UPI0039917799
MATKSRLGKGLGALFPALPGDPNEPAQQNDALDHEQASATDGNEPIAHDKALVNEPENRQRSDANPTQDQTTSAKQQRGGKIREHVSRETSQHAASSSANTKHAAHGVSRLPHRMSIPSLEEMTHPSDVFFGAMQSTEATVEKRVDEGKSGSREQQPDMNTVSAGKSQTVPQGPVTTATADEHTTPDGNVSRETSASDGAEKQALKPVQGGYLAELRLDEIGPNKEQPRTIFDEDELRELAESIREVGVLQPIVVRKRPQSQLVATTDHQSESKDANGVMHRPYELIMGERRWRASQLAGLETIPAIVKTTSDDEMLRDALLENLHRVALNPLEEAAAYQQMIDEFGLTQAQLSKSVSKSRPQIANTLRLLNLPASVQKKVAAGVLSAGHARALLGLSNEEDMDKLANRIIAEGLSVRSTEEIVALKTMAGEQPKKESKKTANPWTDSPIRQHLEQRLDTKVTIRGSQKKGRIEITFSSPDDMQRILDILMPQQQEGNAPAAADGESDWV